MKSIEQQIRCALSVEEQEHTLESALQASHEQIARLVELNQENTGQQLLDFISLYIRSVPNLLNDLKMVATKKKLIRSVQPLIDIALEFFNLPSHALGRRSGLTALMVKAYLAHRLLEEVNDACMFHTGTAIVPMDMSFTNTIVHTLIGEPFANDMDQLVDETVKKLFKREHKNKGFIQELSNSNLVHICQQWPSLSGQVGLYSSLAEQPTFSANATSQPK